MTRRPESSRLHRRFCCTALLLCMYQFHQFRCALLSVSLRHLRRSRLFRPALHRLSRLPRFAFGGFLSLFLRRFLLLHIVKQGHGKISCRYVQHPFRAEQKPLDSGCCRPCSTPGDDSGRSGCGIWHHRRPRVPDSSSRYPELCPVTAVIYILDFPKQHQLLLSDFFLSDFFFLNFFRLNLFFQNFSVPDFFLPEFPNLLRASVSGRCRLSRLLFLSGLRAPAASATLFSVSVLRIRGYGTKLLSHGFCVYRHRLKLRFCPRLFCMNLFSFCLLRVESFSLKFLPEPFRMDPLFLNLSPQLLPDVLRMGLLPPKLLLQTFRVRPLPPKLLLQRLPLCLFQPFFQHCQLFGTTLPHQLVDLLCHARRQLFLRLRQLPADELFHLFLHRRIEIPERLFLIKLIQQLKILLIQIIFLRNFLNPVPVGHIAVLHCFPGGLLCRFRKNHGSGIEGSAPLGMLRYNLIGKAQKLIPHSGHSLLFSTACATRRFSGCLPPPGFHSPAQCWPPEDRCPWRKIHSD